MLATCALFSCGNNESNAQEEKNSKLLVERTRKIREENRSLVTKARNYLNEGQIIDVNEVVESNCQGTTSKYQISKVDGELNLGLNIKLIPASDLENNLRKFQLGVEKVRSCVSEIRSFFKKYDINFAVNFLTQNDESEKIHGYVNLTSNDVRSDASTFSLKSSDFCKMVLHELGHHLGLSDEYVEDDTCRTKEFSSKDTYPWSLMDDFRTIAFELFPRHFKTILGPVFDPSDETEIAKSPPHYLVTLKKDIVEEGVFISKEVAIGREINFCQFITKYPEFWMVNLKAGKSFRFNLIWENYSLSLFRRRNGIRDYYNSVVFKIDHNEIEGDLQLECVYNDSKVGLEGAKIFLKEILELKSITENSF